MISLSALATPGTLAYMVGSASTIARTCSGVFPSTFSVSHARLALDIVPNCLTSDAVIASGCKGTAGAARTGVGAARPTAAGVAGGGVVVVGSPSEVRRRGRRCCPAASSSAVVGAIPASRRTSLVGGSSAPMTSARPSGCAALGCTGLPNRSVCTGAASPVSAIRISTCCWSVPPRVSAETLAGRPALPAA